MVDMTTTSEVAAVARSEAGRATTPAQAKAVAQALGRLTGWFAQHSADAETAVARATTVLASFVRREANVLSIIDSFQVAFWAAIVGLVLISLMRAAPAGPLTPALAK